MRGRLFSRTSSIRSSVQRSMPGRQQKSVNLSTGSAHEYKGQHSSRSYRSRFLFGATAIGAAFAAVPFVVDLLDRKKEDARVNVELPTYNEMRQYKNNLMRSFYQDNDGDEVIQLTFEALLDAISSNKTLTTEDGNKTLIAEDLINDLIKLHAVVTAETRDAIIVFTANHSKIEILELLQKIFGEDEVLRNKRARRLLSLSPLEKEKVQYYLEQFYQSPGEIKPDGMVMFVAVNQEDILKKMLEYRTYQPVYSSYDLADDIAESYRQVMSAKKINEQMQTRFERTIVVDLSESETYEQAFERYCRKLASIAKAENKPVDGTFITAGAHYCIGQIRVVHREFGSTSATVIFIDPKGTYGSVLTNDYCFIASIPPHVYDDVRVFISEDKNQLAGIGCSLFVCDQHGTIMTLDELMEANTQYPFAGNEGVIFDYAEYAKTSQHPYGIDFDGDEGTYASVGMFWATRIPVVLTIGKQSLESPGMLLDAPEEFKLEPNGRYTSGVHEADKPTDFPGAMGLRREMREASPDKRKELSGPADISGDKTVAEVIESGIENAEHKGSVKPRNKRIDHSAYGFGFFMSNYVDSILRHDSVMPLESDRSTIQNKH